MNILITGSTGFLGRFLIRRLLENGHHCRCLVRKTSNIQELPKSEYISFYYGDVTDRNSLKGICKNIDIVCHLASIMGHIGRLSETKKIKKKFYQINVEGVKNISQEALDSSIKKFIYISTTAAMGTIDRKIADENTPCQPLTLYQKTKYEAEKSLLDLFKQKNFPVVILRPSVFYGPGYVGDLLKLAKFIKKGIFFQVGKELNLTPAIHIEDAVQGIVLAIDKAPLGQVYIITSERSYPLKNITDSIARVLKKSYKIIYIPLPLALFLSTISELSHRLLHTPNLITKESLYSIVTDRIFSIEKAKKELGFLPKIPIEKGIEEALEWAEKNGYL